MFYSHKIKTIFKNILITNFFQKLLRFKDNSIGTILMLHRIERPDPSHIQCNEHLKISPEFLESTILEFKKKGFSFISMDELYDVLIHKKDTKKLIVFTLDDGYQDNIINGLPIFRKYSIPFTIYVSTGMVEREFIYWNCLIEDLILQNNKIILDDGSSYSCKNKEKVFMALRKKIIKIHPRNLQKDMNKLFSNYNIDLYKYSDRLPLTWGQIKLLRDEPLATIGCHSHSHSSMNFFSKEENILDIKKANSLFKEKTNITPKHFCYPYGENISNKEAEAIKSLGFKTAVTGSGNIYPKHANNLFLLPRIFITEKLNPKLQDQMTWLKYFNK